MKKMLQYIIGLFAMTVFPSFTLADGGYFVMDGYRGGMMNGFYWGGMGFGFLFFFIFWGIVIYLAVIAFRHFTEKKDRETPLELLKKRLAKGEVTEEEFEKIKKKL